MSALWSAGDLVAATGGAMPAPFAAGGISIDSRTIRPGELFAALLGEAGDGHDFVARALAAGAAGALVHRRPADVAEGAPLLAVADTLTGLHDLGRFARARFTGRLVGVTGSVGKTTTKEMLRRILAAHGTTHAAEASYNNQWGVPVTLARMPPDARFGVAEIGMNHAGEIAPLARLARPHVAVITAIAPVHIGHLGSIEAIADEKASIAAGLEPGGVLLAPAQSDMLPRVRAATSHRIETFGATAGADHRLVEARADADGTDIVARIAGRELRLRIAAPGGHMAMNAVAALAAASLLGVDAASAARALEGFSAVIGRGQRRPIPVSGGTALLLDESYNASSVAVRAALGVLALIPATRRVVVLGDMRELGEAGPAEHASLIPDVLAHADLLFTCGPLMRAVHDAMPPARRGAHAEDSATLAPIVAAALRPGDAVLVKGSLGTRMKTIVSALEAIAPVPEHGTAKADS